MNQLNRFLIITGGSRGIGLATVKHFIAAGWQVINLSRHPNNIPGVTNIFIDLQFLVSEQEEIQHQLQARIPEAAVICLVHNAGIFFHDNVAEQLIKEVRTTLEVNLLAPIILNQMLIPLMAPGSAIIYIGSTLSEKAIAGCASYIISKHAIAGLMRATCQDLAGRFIHTCCVCPGITETEMLLERCKKVPGLLEELSKISTYNRLLQPEELAELIAFCAEHPLINGSIVHGNLGQIER